MNSHEKNSWIDGVGNHYVKTRRGLRAYIRMLGNPRSYRCLMTSVLAMQRNQKSQKVFAIGLNKTGTSSIDVVFRKLGFHAVHSTYWSQKNHRVFLFCYDAFSDGNTKQFADLDRMFPGAKFVLNVRDLDSWLDSRLAHLEFAVKGSRFFKERGTWARSDNAVRGSIASRNEHHLNVLNYFIGRPDDLLVVNYIRDPDAAKKIGAFLGHQVEMDKPHKHPIPVKRDQSKLMNSEKIARVLTEMNVPEEEWSYDLFCPSLVENPADKNWVPDTSLRLD